MKTIKFLMFALIIAVSLLAVSCSKDSKVTKNLASEVEGIYKGTLSNVALGDSVESTVNVTRADFNMIYIRCTAPGFDTTFMMELFENGDSLMVCNTGDDFFYQYGHERMDEHHNMMDDENWQSWSHHKDEEHKDADEHFGGFDLVDRSFAYRFVIKGGLTLHFNGIK